MINLTTPATDSLLKTNLCLSQTFFRMIFTLTYFYLSTEKNQKVPHSKIAVYFRNREEERTQPPTENMSRIIRQRTFASSDNVPSHHQTTYLRIIRQRTFATSENVPSHHQTTYLRNVRKCTFASSDNVPSQRQKTYLRIIRQRTFATSENVPLRPVCSESILGAFLDSQECKV